MWGNKRESTVPLTTEQKDAIKRRILARQESEEIEIDGIQTVNYINEVLNEAKQINSDEVIIHKAKLFRGNLDPLLDLLTSHPFIKLRGLTVYPKNGQFNSNDSNNNNLELVLENAKRIADVITKTPSLTYLDLSDNRDIGDGWTYILDAIKSHTALQTLVLKRCDLFDLTNPDLTLTSLNENKSITDINISNNIFTNSRWNIANLIRGNKRLKVLQANLVRGGSKIDLKEVIAALKFNNTLVSIKLDKYSDAWKDMKEVLVGSNANTTLEAVDFFEFSAATLGTPEDQTAVEILRKNQFLTHISTDTMWRSAHWLLRQNRLRKIDAKNVFIAAQVILLPRDRGLFDLLPKELLLQIFNEVQYGENSGGDEPVYLLTMSQIEKIIAMAQERERFLSGVDDTSARRQQFFKSFLTCT